ncbi:RNA polymerase sigma factor [Pedobacter antarcticus]|uniref:RNA polymerase sigma factor n=1 Tax=Pedobacter antarcticus TaxID=34086 RepID=UPI002930C8A5|nr:DUF6596 domain-containing protein [Pedobacter antarcticus]
MEERELIPHLFRTEYRKMVSVLCYLFGIKHIEIAEDIVSETFLAATEIWGMNGNPENPAAWLYAVAKNKTRNYLKHNSIFEVKISEVIKRSTNITEELSIDFSSKNITDSQLAMIFAVCNSAISVDAQIALALNLLCGFGIQEIADAFLSNKEVIYKRINRAKEKLRDANIRIEQPSLTEISGRLDTVLTTLYLLFSEGYYSSSQQTTLRKEFCAEAMRLNYLLIENKTTNLPEVNALFALMCFHASRFEARTNGRGESILYDDQDETLWNRELIEKGIYYLGRASTGTVVSRYHLEASIAYWHTQKVDSTEKWENILQLYNQLLILEYSPIAALNRTYTLSKTNGKQAAIDEAEKLKLNDNALYYALLGNLYTDVDDEIALKHYQTAIELTKSAEQVTTIKRNIAKLHIK